MARKTPKRMKIVYWKVEDLRHDELNVRTHDARNIGAIVDSLKGGVEKPIVITRDGTIIAGNGTLEAAKKLGLTELPCVVTDRTGDALKAFAIADNRTAELAEWDLAELQVQLEKFRDDEFLLNAAGFTEAELDKLGKTEVTFNVADRSDQLTGMTYQVVVELGNEREQAKLVERLEKEGLTCRIQTL